MRFFDKDGRIQHIGNFISDYGYTRSVASVGLDLVCPNLSIRPALCFLSHVAAAPCCLRCSWRALSTPTSLGYRGVMDAIDFQTLDARIEMERTQLSNALRRIADRLDTLAVEDGGPW